MQRMGMCRAYGLFGCVMWSVPSNRRVFFIFYSLSRPSHRPPMARRLDSMRDRTVTIPAFGMSLGEVPRCGDLFSTELGCVIRPLSLAYPTFPIRVSPFRQSELTSLATLSAAAALDALNIAASLQLSVMGGQFGLSAAVAYRNDEGTDTQQCTYSRRALLPTRRMRVDFNTVFALNRSTASCSSGSAISSSFWEDARSAGATHLAVELVLGDFVALDVDVDAGSSVNVLAIDASGSGTATYAGLTGTISASVGVAKARRSQMKAIRATIHATGDRHRSVVLGTISESGEDNMTAAMSLFVDTMRDRVVAQHDTDPNQARNGAKNTVEFVLVPISVLEALHKSYATPNQTIVASGTGNARRAQRLRRLVEAATELQNAASVLSIFEASCAQSKVGSSRPHRWLREAQFLSAGISDHLTALDDVFMCGVLDVVTASPVDPVYEFSVIARRVTRSVSEIMQRAALAFETMERLSRAGVYLLPYVTALPIAGAVYRSSSAIGVRSAEDTDTSDDAGWRPTMEMRCMVPLWDGQDSAILATKHSTYVMSPSVVALKSTANVSSQSAGSVTKPPAVPSKTKKLERWVVTTNVVVDHVGCTSSPSVTATNPTAISVIPSSAFKTGPLGPFLSSARVALERGGSGGVGSVTVSLVDVVDAALPPEMVDRPTFLTLLNGELVDGLISRQHATRAALDCPPSRLASAAYVNELDSNSSPRYLRALLIGPGRKKVTAAGRSLVVATGGSDGDCNVQEGTVPLIVDAAVSWVAVGGVQIVRRHDRLGFPLAHTAQDGWRLAIGSLRPTPAALAQFEAPLVAELERLLGITIGTAAATVSLVVHDSVTGARVAQGRAAPGGPFQTETTTAVPSPVSPARVASPVYIVPVWTRYACNAVSTIAVVDGSGFTMRDDDEMVDWCTEVGVGSFGAVFPGGVDDASGTDDEPASEDVAAASNLAWRLLPSSLHPQFDALIDEASTAPTATAGDHPSIGVPMFVVGDYSNGCGVAGSAGSDGTDGLSRVVDVCIWKAPRPAGYQVDELLPSRPWTKNNGGGDWRSFSLFPGVSLACRYARVPRNGVGTPFVETGSYYIFAGTDGKRCITLRRDGFAGSGSLGLDPFGGGGTTRAGSCCCQRWYVTRVAYFEYVIRTAAQLGAAGAWTATESPGDAQRSEVMLLGYQSHDTQRFTFSWAGTEAGGGNAEVDARTFTLGWKTESSSQLFIQEASGNSQISLEVAPKNFTFVAA